MSILFIIWTYQTFMLYQRIGCPSSSQNLTISLQIQAINIIPLVIRKLLFALYCRVIDHVNELPFGEKMINRVCFVGRASCNILLDFLNSFRSIKLTICTWLQDSETLDATFFYHSQNSSKWWRKKRVMLRFYSEHEFPRTWHGEEPLAVMNHLKSFLPWAMAVMICSARREDFAVSLVGAEAAVISTEVKQVIHYFMLRKNQNSDKNTARN